MKKRYTICMILVVFAVVTASVVSAQNPHADDALIYLQENPDSVAAICMDPDGTTITHNADLAFPLASAYKVIVLAEYARQASEGLIDPEMPVDLADLDRFYLPGTDGGAHDLWLQTEVSDGNSDVTLDDIARAMIVYSSNAAPDYLLDMMGVDGFETLFDAIGTEALDVPVSALGLFLTSSNHERPIVDFEAVPSPAITDDFRYYAELYTENAEWRAAERAARESSPLLGLSEGDFLALQFGYFDSFNFTATAADLTLVMRAFFTGDSLSDEAKIIAQRHLNWPLEFNPAAGERFVHLGAKGGSLPGILTGLIFAEDVDGNMYQSTLLYRGLGQDQWFDWITRNPLDSLQGELILSGCTILADALVETGTE